MNHSQTHSVDNESVKIAEVDQAEQCLSRDRGDILTPRVTEERISLNPNKDSNPQDEIVSDKTAESERIIKQKK